MLSVRNLKTWFYTYDGIVKAIDGINLEVKEKSILGIVGESGCGKSVTAQSIMNLVPNPGKIVSGKILFENSDILKMNEAELRSLRGNDIAMIFQRPSSSLNPVVSIGKQLISAIQIHGIKDKPEAEAAAVKMLKTVGLPDPEKQLKKYPHEMSGGMLQRIMIAIALSGKPKLLIADEPTTALDVTIQAQVLNIMKDLSADFSTSIMMITHDLGIVAEMCDTVAVMYAGQIVERSPVKGIFEEPLHPYCQGLLESLPDTSHKTRLSIIPGSVCSLIDPPSGCRFHPRCSKAMDICTTTKPEMKEVKAGHEVACHLYREKA